MVLDPPFDTRPTARRAELRDVLYSNKFPFTKIIRVIKEARKKAEYVVLKYMPSTEEEIELLRLSPLHVITWRFVMSRVLVNENNKVVRNASKLYIYD